MQHKSTLVLIVALLLLPFVLRCQEPRIGILASNNVTSFPVTGFPKVFHTQFHPGIDVCRDWKINKKEKEQIWITANTGVFYHRFVQTAVRLYGTLEYRYLIGKRVSAFIGLGGGYIHAFENNSVLKLNDEGVYEKKSRITGRPQYTAQLNLGCSYAVKKDDPASMKIIMQMRSFIQGPFVNNYVPMLPVNSFALGLSIPLKCKKDEK